MAYNGNASKDVSRRCETSFEAVVRSAAMQVWVAGLAIRVLGRVGVGRSGSGLAADASQGCRVVVGTTGATLGGAVVVLGPHGNAADHNGHGSEEHEGVVQRRNVGGHRWTTAAGRADVRTELRWRWPCG